MKSLKKGFEAHGNEHKTHKPSKHDANLRKTGTLYFQIGLLISSVLVFSVFQINFKVQEYDENLAMIDAYNEIFEIDAPVFKVYEEPTQDQNEPKTDQKTKIIDVIEVIDDDDFDKAKNNVVTPDDFPTEPNPDGNIEFVAPDVVIGTVDFKKVEFVPIFPGCESLETNNERKVCMSEKIDRIVRRNFRTTKAVDYGLTGKQKIFVQFKINKQGLVSDVKVRAPHKVLEDEARRVTKLIPQMKPGRQRNQDVEVVFLKPIVFMVQ